MILWMKTAEPQNMCSEEVSSDPSTKESFLYSECNKPCLQRVSAEQNEFITTKGGLDGKYKEFGHVYEVRPDHTSPLGLMLGRQMHCFVTPGISLAKNPGYNEGRHLLCDQDYICLSGIGGSISVHPQQLRKLWAGDFSRLLSLDSLDGSFIPRAKESSGNDMAKVVFYVD